MERWGHQQGPASHTPVVSVPLGWRRLWHRLLAQLVPPHVCARAACLSQTLLGAVLPCPACGDSVCCRLCSEQCLAAAVCSSSFMGTLKPAGRGGVSASSQGFSLLCTWRLATSGRAGSTAVQMVGCHQIRGSALGECEADRRVCVEQLGAPESSEVEVV